MNYLERLKADHSTELEAVLEKSKVHILYCFFYYNFICGKNPSIWEQVL